MRGLAIAIMILASATGCDRAAVEGENTSYNDLTVTALPDANNDLATSVDYPTTNANGHELGAGNYTNGDTYANGNSQGAQDPGRGPAGASAGIPYCALIQDQVPAAECDYYREIWARLETGESALDAPARMTRGDTVTVSFALARQSSETRPTDILDSPPEQTFTARVGRRMAARLEGDGFTIEPTGLVERDLFAGGAARWDWQVTAQKAPRHRLRLQAFVIVQQPNGPRGENLIRTVARDIQVDVTTGQRIRDWMEESQTWFGLANKWLLALAALIGGGVYALWAAIRKFGKPKQEGGGAGEPPEHEG